MRRILLCLALASPCFPSSPDSLMERGHSHNDYEQERPLLEALENGFLSIEADVFLRDGRLLVAHEEHELSPDRTLEGMYLRPLWDRASAREFRSVYDEPAELQLMIDVKSEAQSALQRLLVLLWEYEEMLTIYGDASKEEGAVAIVLSGNRSIESVRAMRRRPLAIDGRPEDLEAGESRFLMPMISSNYHHHFQWRGEGPMRAAERKWLADYAARAHANGQTIRFWAVPPAVQEHPDWISSPVDWLNTDRPAELRKMLLISPE